MPGGFGDSRTDLTVAASNSTPTVSLLKNNPSPSNQIVKGQIGLTEEDTNSNGSTSLSSTTAMTKPNDLNRFAETTAATHYQVVDTPNNSSKTVIVQDIPQQNDSESKKKCSTSKFFRQKVRKRPLLPSSSPSVTGTTSTTTNLISESIPISDSVSPSDHLLSQIPLMNSMVRYKLQQLLKEREMYIRKCKNPQEEREIRKRPVAVLTAYSVRKVPSTKNVTVQENEKQSSGRDNSPSDSDVLYKNFLPFKSGPFRAIIHLDKFYCPGTNRPCIEYGGILMTPSDLLQMSGHPFHAKWKSIFKTLGGQTVESQFEQGKMDFKNHNVFCTGACSYQLPVPALSLKNIFNDILVSRYGQNKNKKRKTVTDFNLTGSIDMSQTVT